jgi:hypothetical protein
MSCHLSGNEKKYDVRQYPDVSVRASRVSLSDSSLGLRCAALGLGVCARARDMCVVCVQTSGKVATDTGMVYETRD